MEVYRVEHIGSEDGPFTGTPFRQYDMDYLDYHKYPTLHDDAFDLRRVDFSWITGVLTRDKIDHWFPPLSDFRAYLRENGYKITTYDVHPDDVRYGRSNLQLIFARRKATKVRQEEL